ncbi:nitrogen fixation protein NifB [Microbulbifer sp. ZKSA006]|uniref:nitrogen fixation protein NifB n=1 Tax=Microbulbifer sp. ZKSA006 TaxID=3243390 RepID=UPI0040394A55
MSRCVRRAFLCGRDRESGIDYEYRREWIESRMHKLSEIFALDIAAYAVMSNHYHVVLYIDRETALSWPNTEVILRWQKLFKVSTLALRYLRGDTLDHSETNKLNEVVTLWRERLMNISWFMRCLNEAIARQTNAEDHCTGRFWEGRFKSQTLLDERALAARSLRQYGNRVRCIRLLPSSSCLAGHFQKSRRAFPHGSAEMSYDDFS